jgi:3-phosphoshikimate 1-carboxyvinyltransferase
MGVRIDSSDGCAPLSIQASPLRLEPLSYSLPVASAQVKSCLLLAALSANGETRLVEPGPSRDHTERMLRSMGVAVTSDQGLATRGESQSPVASRQSLKTYITRLNPPTSRSLKPLNLRLPGDISSAAFLIVAALITPGSEIHLRGVGLNPTRTGLLEALQAMGADIQVSGEALRSDEPVGDLRVRSSDLQGTMISGPLVVRMIDEFPAFAVAAAFAHGKTLVCDAEELRHKESDRISALCAQLRRLGAGAQETLDGFAITGTGKLEGGEAHSCDDHRLAMALSIAGLAAEGPVTVEGAEMTDESFPGYVETLRFLGANIILSDR